MAVKSNNEIVKTGRRKCSIAVAKLVKGKGNIIINGKTLKGYFGNRPTLEMMIFRPLVLTENENKFDIRVRAIGGGVSAQAGAIRHAISRALVEINEEFNSKEEALAYLENLKSLGYIIIDPLFTNDTKVEKDSLNKTFANIEYESVPCNIKE